MTLNEQILEILFDESNADIAVKKIELILLQSQVDLLNEVYDLIGTDSPKSSIKEMISELKQQINNLSK